jgi:hypothetical protein
MIVGMWQGVSEGVGREIGDGVVSGSSGGGGESSFSCSRSAFGRFPEFLARALCECHLSAQFGRCSFNGWLLPFPPANLSLEVHRGRRLGRRGFKLVLVVGLFVGQSLYTGKRETGYTGLGGGCGRSEGRGGGGGGGVGGHGELRYPIEIKVDHGEVAFHILRARPG